MIIDKVFGSNYVEAYKILLSNDLDYIVQIENLGNINYSYLNLIYNILSLIL